nr:MBL fold metallo-hydrolase [uncultured Sharpea sp.]
MELTMLGTGNALVTECYNTCYVFEENDKYFLVDGGGGNEILKRLKYNNIDYRKIHDIMITHKHIDHLLGIIWAGNMREKLISMVMTRSLHYFVI